MAKLSKVIVIKEALLALNEREVGYLMDLTRNYIGPNLTDEPSDENEMRQSIFEALEEVKHG